MVKRFTSLLRRIVGRIDKVKLLRDLALIILALLFGFAYPLMAEVANSSNWSSMWQIIKDYPNIIIILIMPFIGLITLILFIHKIDKWEDNKEDERIKKIIGELNEQARTKSESDHFQSVL